MRRREMQVALDRQAQPAAHGFKLGQTDGTKLGTTHAKVAKAEGDVRVFRVDLGQEPGTAGVGREQFHDGQEVGFGFLVHLELQSNAAISEQSFADICGQEFHGGLSFRLGFSQDAKEKAGRRSHGVTQDSVRFGRVTEGNPQTKESLD